MRGHDDGISTVRAGSGRAVDVLTARPASGAIVVDAGAAPHRERLDGRGTTTRRTVVDGVAFVHQRLRGRSLPGPPRALLQHFPAETGTWDPMAPPRTSGDREIILIEHLDGTGIEAAEPDLDRLARESLEFIDALGLAALDLLGFSLGVRPPEDVLLLSPRLVQRLVTASHEAR